MHRFVIRLILATLICFSAQTWGAELLEGRDYTVLRQAQPTANPGKIVITEFFSYQCPHCYAFSVPLERWIAKLPADVVCTRESVAVGHDAWEPMARTFYALQSMGKLQTLDASMFRAIHVEHVSLVNEDGIANWLAKQRVSPAEFRAAYRSFGVDAQWKRGRQLAIAHKVPGIPTISIDGKYLVAIASNVDFAKQLANIDTLIAKVRAERKRRL